jgi:hypothetical protein
MEAMCSSETFIDFQRTTRRYIPEDSTVRSEDAGGRRWPVSRWNTPEARPANELDGREYGGSTVHGACSCRLGAPSLRTARGEVSWGQCRLRITLSNKSSLALFYGSPSGAATCREWRIHTLLQCSDSTWWAQLDEFIHDIPGGQVNILGGHSIGHSKQKSVYVHVSYSEQFPR